MKKTLAVIISLFAVSVAFAQDARTELIQSLKTSGVAEDLDSSPDGIAIRLLPDGGFQIFSMGTGVYDFDDPEDIADARKDFYEALYSNADSKSAQNGLKEIEKTAGEMYNKASEAARSGDDAAAKKLLRKLKRELAPTSEYYLRVLALLDDLKSDD